MLPYLFISRDHTAAARGAPLIDTWVSSFLSLLDLHLSAPLTVAKCPHEHVCPSQAPVIWHQLECAKHCWRQTQGSIGVLLSFLAELDSNLKQSRNLNSLFTGFVKIQHSAGLCRRNQLLCVSRQLCTHAVSKELGPEKDSQGRKQCVV